MNWKLIIEELSASGLSQRDIAKLVGISQPRIADLKRGNSTVTYEVGDRLVSLWKVRVKHAA